MGALVEPWVRIVMPYALPSRQELPCPHVVGRRRKQTVRHVARREYDYAEDACASEDEA